MIRKEKLEINDFKDIKLKSALAKYTGSNYQKSIISITKLSNLLGVLSGHANTVFKVTYIKYPTANETYDGITKESEHLDLKLAIKVYNEL